MKQIFVSIILTTLALISCQDNSSERIKDNKTDSFCSDKCEAKNKTSELSCKLTTPELQKRKATILESLRKQMIERKELPHGVAFKFTGTDKMVDELIEFIKTERVCCDFFTFNLSISGDKSEAWLELTGVEGTKDVIKNELEL